MIQLLLRLKDFYQLLIVMAYVSPLIKQVKPESAKETLLFNKLKECVNEFENEKEKK